MSASAFKPAGASTPQELAAAFAEALGRGDVDAAASMWIEDASIITAAGEQVQGSDAIRAALGALVEHGTEVEIELSQSFTAGDVALALGTLTLSGEGADGRPFRHRSSSAVIYARGLDGCWRIALDAPWGLPGQTAGSTG